MKIKRLGGTKEEPYCIEIRQHWPDPTMILIHLERLQEINVQSKASFAMVDEIFVDFTYKGFPFSITSPLSYPWISASSPDVPEHIFEEIVNHIRNYKTVWPHQLIAGILRHMKLPKLNR